MSDKRIKVMVVDDTAFMRKAVTQILETDPEIEVIGWAVNGKEALEKIPELNPNVITLDIDMPVMDGLTAIRHIMIKSPTPIVVLSSLVTDGAITFEALRLGVVDFVPKPSGAVSVDIEKAKKQLIDRVKVAHTVCLENVRRVRLSQKGTEKLYRHHALDYIVVIGTTLSGPNTVIRLLSNLPTSLPAAIIVHQEISPKVISSFVEQFNKSVEWQVKVAQDGLSIEQGHCYICSNEYSLSVSNSNGKHARLKMEDGIPYPLNKLFSSAAHVYGSKTIGVLLSGTGDDGALGFSDIRKASGVTLAKDARCCVFPNLTHNAIQSGVVDKVLIERHMAKTLEQLMK